MKNKRNEPGSANSSTYHDQSVYELLLALQAEGSGCVVCHLVQRGVEGYLQRISYENVTDVDTRLELREALGYCAVHGQEWLRLHDTLGTAIIYGDVLDHVLSVLRGDSASIDVAANGSKGLASTDPGTKNSGVSGVMSKVRMILGSGRGDANKPRDLAEMLEPRLPCPACRYMSEHEMSWARSFLEGLAHHEFAEAYRKHEIGLCLPHFRKVLRAAKEEVLPILVQMQRAKLESTAADLSEVRRKNDYRYSGETQGIEYKAPGRSVEQVAGKLPTQLNWPR